MNRPHLIINLLAFITILVALFFGMSIFNAYDNQHITHLNEFENYNYNPVKDVPVLTAQAVVFTSVFVLTAFGFQIYTFFKTEIKTRKRIITAMLPIYLILIGYSVYLISNTKTQEFYSYGMIWVLLSILLIFGNSIILFIRK